MKLFKNIATTVVASACFLNLGIAQSADWIMTSGYPEDNFHTKNIQMFIDEVEQNTSVNIALNANDSLIKLNVINTALQRGQVAIGEIRLGVYGNEDPMYTLSGLPFIAPDYESAWKLKDMQKPYFDSLFKEAGLRILYYTPWPGQGFYTKFPVNSTADFEGKKLRIYSTATQQMGELLGFDATILPFAEIPQAFSTGLIEALFTSPQTGIDIQAWDNTTDFTYAGAIFTKNAVVVNEKFFSALSAEDQAAILAAAATAETRGWELSEETTKAQLATLAENGMTVTDAPEQVIEKMKEIGLVMIDNWRADASPEAEAVLDKFLGM
ncbi:MAG: TRAP-type C4-dicarboxylate transport system substrate-binding protein [Halioglobus sp.]|jgi:TRAP-type C4-dicarboxylate transport system substrate-binding protein